ncbi:ABC transporter ATP-binding protein [Massilia arenosa]|uniref:ABC transporter ATP-binding protein n=1 Tax=Zemynaea arenosa TaxID=2561931 RepID=A0A4Y9S7P2_9BURK|nr:ABC transporter ATP-binding protein [Massilia arenosa]TFW15747.1 ABC transporter ATP-binding protein [Massilia arenosa]
MAQVKLKNIGKRYDGAARDAAPVLQGIDLEVRNGEFLVLVGPSGCGKSTLLRMIAGLESISEGDLFIAEQRANDVPPAQRGIAMVFQSYALYPHMTVFENMAFALQLAGQSAAQVKAAVERAAETLQIAHLLQRRPKGLSGGQRQRVAIGRAIVRKPAVFLFDEPLSNLDAGLRVQMRLELARLHRELGATMIYVTHDQMEAMTLGERIVVLNGGRIEQAGTPHELYNAPANRFVAGFLGSPRMNFLPARADGAGRVLLRDGAAAVLPQYLVLPDGELTLGIRAEHLQVAAEGVLPATVGHVEYLGDQTLLYTTDGLAVRLGANAAAPRPGDAVRLGIPPAQCRLFGASGAAIPAVQMDTI